MDSEKLSNRARFVMVMLTTMTVVLTLLSYFVAVATIYGHAYPRIWNIINPDFLIVCLFISIYWSLLDTWLKLNEVYRSRSYGYIVLFHFVESVLGVILLTFTSVVFGLTFYGRNVMFIFGGLCFCSTLTAKLLFYFIMRKARRNGYNSRKVFFVCDKGGDKLLSLLYKNYEWGYKIVGVIGDSYIVNKYNGLFPVYDASDTDIDRILTQEVEDLIYAKNYDSSQEIMRYIDICNEMGITFRLYSQFFNRMSKNTQLRYFDTNAVITITNTPTNYVGLLTKRAFDIAFSLCVILFGLPFFIIIALIIKIDSKGPIFFRQKRSGLRGKVFEVYKFRTMVVNAEEMRDELMDKNEMDGPVFKIANDPRITRVGKILRKTGIDEFPQFINVFLGDMSVVGPRPPLPKEVEQYERWQLRRLAMQPGITCLWQVARDRNKITFEEWMNMDMEYIDNWSVALDMVIILKTIRTVFRADGK